MRFFGFAIIRWKRLQEMHNRRAWLQAQLDVAQEQIHKLLTAPGPADLGADEKEGN